MNEQWDYIELVRKAQRGDQESLERLAERARERLSVFAYRLTLDDDLGQEIVQESLFEMCRILGKLRDADRFWPWLYGIATNKLRRHHRTESTRRRVAGARAGLGRSRTLKEAQDGLQTMVSEELKEIVAAAMKRLKTRHRAVLVMRCYDEMSYAEIAESMGCSEFSTRMLFLRAKRSLQKQLSRNGFGKGSLLAALVVFGKITAPTEAAAAEVSVSAATVEVGALAAIAGLATSKSAVVSVATAGVLAAGGVAVKPYVTGQTHPGGLNGNQAIVGSFDPAETQGEERWYYYPKGAGEPLMIRVKAGSPDGGGYSQYLQNEQANYVYRDNEVHINNHRMYAGDLSVMTLPTDSSEMKEFISQMQGGRGSRKMQSVSNTGEGLLVIAAASAEAGGNQPWVTRHYNVLDEDYFRCDWPANAQTIDNRDAMHRRGWTYFRIAGSVGGEEVSGAGRIAFVYGAYKQHRPWLRLRVGQEVEVVDTDAGAALRRRGKSAVRMYRPESFFAGLLRPWMGLHAVDTVRRDAARQRLPFETEAGGDGSAQVTVYCPTVRMVYTIDLEDDLIERIDLFEGEQSVGSLEFRYLQDAATAGGEFAKPGVSRLNVPRAGPGIGWLAKLVDGSLGR